MNRPKTHGGCKLVCSDGSKWEALLTEVAFSMLEKLLEPLDHVRFATVCKRWCSIAKEYNQTTRPWHGKQVLPMLMIPPSSSNAAHNQGIALYSVSERTMYSNIRLPAPENEKYCGFSHGWLASVDNKSRTNITLRKFPPDRNGGLNVIHLPPLKLSMNERRYYEKIALPKVILSADPTLHMDRFAVLAIYYDSHKAAFIAGERSHWIKLDPRCYPKYAHAIFYDSYGYLVNTWVSSLVRFDAEGNNSYLERLTTEPRTSPRCCSYFVESTNGELLLVEKVSVSKDVFDTSFKVSQLIHTQYNHQGGVDAQVLEVNSIGDEALFVCESHSMSVLASNVRGCQPNSIYFAYNSGSTWEVGIFSLENKSTTRLYSLNHCETDYIMPFWITTSFEGLC